MKEDPRICINEKFENGPWSCFKLAQIRPRAKI